MNPIKIIFSLSALLGCVSSAHSSMYLEWDRIANWTGNGENTVAIGIQFNDGMADCIYVYGYRWQGDTAPDCREVLRAICRANDSLCMLEQRVSRADNGYRLGGIGFGMGNSVLSSLYFDFAAACLDGTIGFNYYAVDLAGQLIGPGDSTPLLCETAIKAALTDGHVVNHPIDALTYGAASYDYDHWKVTDINRDVHWNAGWNIGNWVMWSGTEDISAMEYAGMGYASRMVKPGEFIVWNFNRHDNYPVDRDPTDGYSGASRPARVLKYVDESDNTSKPEYYVDERQSYSLYTLDGHKISKVSTPGLYVIRDSRSRSRLIFLKPDNSIPHKIHKL